MSTSELLVNFFSVFSRCATFSGVGGGFSLLGQATFQDVEVTEDDYNKALIGKTPVLVSDTSASLWLDHAFQAAVLDGLWMCQVGKQGQ